MYIFQCFEIFGTFESLLQRSDTLLPKSRMRKGAI